MGKIFGKLGKLSLYAALMGLVLMGSSCQNTEDETLSPVLSAEIQGGQVNIRLENGALIRLWTVSGGVLRVRIESEMTPFADSPFFLEKPSDNQKIVKEGEGFRLGPYLVVPRRGGYSLSFVSEGKPLKLLYRSEVALQGSSLVELKHALDEEEFLGMGAVTRKHLLKQDLITIYQHAQYGSQTYLNIPYHYTTGGDAFYYNSQMGDTFSFGNRAPSTVALVAQKGSADYYYYYEPHLKANVQKFYELTQSRSLLPKWAFGYIQSRFGYRSQGEALEVVKEFERREVPLSALVLDLYWYKKMGDLDWNREKWPNPAAFEKELEKRGIRLITISQTYMTNDSLNFERYEKNRWLVQDAVHGGLIRWKSWWAPTSIDGSMIDLFAPGAAEDLQSQYARMYRQGIDGFWTDLGEPEESPDNAGYGAQWSKQDVHNHYNREWSRIVYEGMRKNFPDVRPFNLTRSGYTGSARYNVSVWSGDVESSFPLLEVQPILGMNAGTSGFSYWGSDVGGFVTGGEASGSVVLPNTGGTGLATSSKIRLPDKELFVRWNQFGALSPVYRAHGSQSPREPWIHEGEAFQAVKEAIELRYTMLPYVYSTAYQTFRDGIPMMRPLFFEHPEVQGVYDETRSYYWGDHLLAAPVVKALPPHRMKWPVTIPPGRWVDFFTYAPVEPGWQELSVKLKSIPLFLKEGAMVPLNEKGQSVLILFPSEKETSWTWYDDDGVSNGYLTGEGSEIRQLTLNSQRLVIRGVTEQGALATGPLILRRVGLDNTDQSPREKGWEKRGLAWEKTVTLKAGENRWDF